MAHYKEKWDLRLKIYENEISIKRRNNWY
jgi:hypothetical protein